jgi:hypothetical protein
MNRFGIERRVNDFDTLYLKFLRFISLINQFSERRLLFSQNKALKDNAIEWRRSDSNGENGKKETN